jgi:hypothetical protein
LNPFKVGSKMSPDEYSNFLNRAKELHNNIQKASDNLETGTSFKTADGKVGRIDDFGKTVQEGLDAVKKSEHPMAPIAAEIKFRSRISKSSS